MLNIKQLIEILSKFDSNLPIYFDYDHGYQQYELENVYLSQYGEWNNQEGKFDYSDCLMLETEFTSPNWEVKEDPANQITLIDMSDYSKSKL